MAISLSLALVCCGEEESTSSPDSTPESITVSVSESESESESESLSVSVAEKHNLTHVPYRDANCRRAGNIDYWQCKDCDKYFSDSAGKTEITKADTVIAQLAHTVYFVEGEDSTCEEEGILSHYACETCPTLFSDDKGANRINEKDLTVAKKPHEMIHHDPVLAQRYESGKVEYWECDICGKFYLDEIGETQVEASDLTTKAPYSAVDFVVEVETGKDPVILHLADTQIIDLSQAPSNYGGDRNYWFWQKGQMYNRCFAYIKEAVEATKPDLILLTGDIVYGRFDDSGSSFLALVEFMETLNVPWAPVFGNHDNESAKGVDWQCEQFENAENCLFLQRELTGNGNYSVGIAQDGYITRAFYMLDTNGCASPSNATLANTHFRREIGIFGDQISWYTEAILELKKSMPSVKISFAYHIPQNGFVKAFEKYGYTKGQTAVINIDEHPEKGDGDFGYLSGYMGEWDANGKIQSDMIGLGADSFFVGHEHNISASVVHNGVRYQFGCKSSEYDKFNQLQPNGTVVFSDVKVVNDTKKSLVGGTVFSLQKGDGTIINPYIYYCENGVYGKA